MSVLGEIEKNTSSHSLFGDTVIFLCRGLYDAAFGLFMKIAVTTQCFQLFLILSPIPPGKRKWAAAWCLVPDGVKPQHQQVLTVCEKYSGSESLLSCLPWLSAMTSCLNVLIEYVEPCKLTLWPSFRISWFNYDFLCAHIKFSIDKLVLIKAYTQSS